MLVKGLISTIIFFLSFFPMSAFGDDSETKDHEKLAEGTKQEHPTMEMLEFLADWETKEGKWIDPTKFEEIVIPEMEQNDEKTGKP